MRPWASFFLLIVAWVPITIDLAYAQDEENSVFSTRFCTVFYERDVNLGTVNRRISFRFSDLYNPAGFDEEGALPIEAVLSDKFDAIFSRVEEILDMYPPRIHVAVNIYKTRDSLDSAYEEIFNEKNTASSFYIYKTNTIYTTERAISANILAHEMAHCIIDRYFVILPPRKIQEMLAAYADVHLND